MSFSMFLCVNRMLSCRYTYGLTIQQTQEAVNEVRFCWGSLQDWVHVAFEIMQHLMQVSIASLVSTFSM